jgi:hypothetical protein
MLDVELRIAELRIADWGLGISDWGLVIGELQFTNYDLRLED